MAVTGKTISKFLTPVCNIFRQTILDGQLCYQADVNILRDAVDQKKAAKEGFVFLLDYNFDRMARVESSNANPSDELSMFEKERRNINQAKIYIETLQ